MLTPSAAASPALLSWYVRERRFSALPTRACCTNSNASFLLRIAQSSRVSAASYFPWRRYNAPRFLSVVVTVGESTFAALCQPPYSPYGAQLRFLSLFSSRSSATCKMELEFLFCIYFWIVDVGGAYLPPRSVCCRHRLRQIRVHGLVSAPVCTEFRLPCICPVLRNNWPNCSWFSQRSDRPGPASVRKFPMHVGSRVQLHRIYFGFGKAMLNCSIVLPRRDGRDPEPLHESQAHVCTMVRRLCICHVCHTTQLNYSMWPPRPDDFRQVSSHEWPARRSADSRPLCICFDHDRLKPRCSTL